MRRRMMSNPNDQDDRDPKEIPQPETDENKPEQTLGFSGLLGIVLVAAALFNVPSILKVPETTADKMMLAIVLTMAFGGAVLLIFRKK